jgi:hypothetical protein
LQAVINVAIFQIARMTGCGRTETIDCNRERLLSESSKSPDKLNGVEIANLDQPSSPVTG